MDFGFFAAADGGVFELQHLQNLIKPVRGLKITYCKSCKKTIFRKQVVKGGVSLSKQKYLLLHNVGRCYSQVLMACWTLNNQGFYVLIFTLV